MTLLALAVCVLLVTGIGLLAVGRRGRRVDDHPVCRRCRFDLFGAPAGSIRCPECGADVSARRAVRIGNRVPHRRLVAVAIPLLAVALTPVAFMAWVAARGADLISYKPVWLLLREAEVADLTVAGRALAELDRRLTAGSLDAGHVDEVAERALTRQGDHARPWVPAWGNLIDRIDSVVGLTKEQRARYQRQSLTYAAEVRPRVMHGVPIVLRVRAIPRYGRGNPHSPNPVRLIRFEIGPLAYTPADWPREIDGRAFEWDSIGFAADVEAAASDAQWAQLAAGGRYDARLFVERLDQAAVPGNPAALQTVAVPMTLTIAGPVTVEPPVPLRRAAELAKAVAGCITVNRIVLDEQLVDAAPSQITARVAVSIRKPPVPVGWAVWLRADGREWPVGLIHLRAGASGDVGCAADVPGFTATRADVVFRPSQAAARRVADLMEIWGEEIVVAGQTVERVTNPAFPATPPPPPVTTPQTRPAAP